MNENIKLTLFEKNNFEKGDSEEYHEISQEVIEETTFVKHSTLPITEFDFFVNHNIQKVKKKKQKKKEKTKSVTDVLNAELATKPLLTNNVVILNKTMEPSYFISKYPIAKIFKQSRKEAFEKGCQMQTSVKISPIFPRVLEAITTNDINIQVQYVEPSLFSDILNDYKVTRESKIRTKFLDILIKDIKFKHHHDFSLEILLCTKLLDLYYEFRSVKKMLIDISKNIEINRRTRNNLKEKLVELSPNNKDDVRFDKNILKYTSNMLECKEIYFNTLKKEKEITHNILSLWADIVMVREKSGNVETDYILEIKRNERDEDDFKNLWSQAFETEYSDLIIKIEYDFIEEYKKYKDLKSKKTNATNKIIRPKLNIDYDNLKVRVEKIVTDIFSRKDVEIKLKRDKSILSIPFNKQVTSEVYNYCFKIFVDNVFVCESEKYRNKLAFFELNFTESLSIEILPHNKSLCIMLYENDNDFSSFRITLADIKTNTNESTFMSTNFIFDKYEETTNTKMGSECDIKEICVKNKTRLKTSNLFKGKLKTNCDVNLKIGWNEKLNNNQCEAIQSSIHTGHQLKRLINNTEKPNINTLTDIINDLYENNVEGNMYIMNALRDLCNVTVENHDEFFFNENLPEFTRFKLLHLRNNGGLGDVGCKAIPLFTSQISTEQLSCLQKSQEKDYRDIKMDSAMDPIDLQRFIGVKFVEKLNRNLKDKLNEFLLEKTFKDVVRDFNDISFRSIFSNQMDLSLSGTSNMMKQQNLKENLTKEQEIQIHILKAYNLTDRGDEFLSEEDNSVENIAGFKVRPLRPFVRLNYHRVSAQTPTAIGCHPTWNYTVKLKTKLDPLSMIHLNIYDEYKDNATEMYSDDEFKRNTVHYRKVSKWLGSIHVPLNTVLNLGSIRGTFKINTPPMLFGYENVSTKDNQLVSEVTQLMKTESSLLVLQITTSLSHLGGYENYSQPVPNNQQDDFIIQHLNNFLTGYLNDFPERNISLTFIDSGGRNKCVAEFLQPIPLPEYELPMDPRKLESAVSKSSGYSKSSSSKSSRRKSSLVDEKESINNKLDTWRSEKNDPTQQLDAAVRYVSLIPTNDDASEPHVVTLMGVELLKVLYGSPLDHTILLCCYFLHLGIKCWVITGFGLPRGPSSYVLVKYSNNKIITIADQVKSLRSSKIWNKADEYTWFIFDAATGERFELREIGCPLKTVSYVFDCENIWVNTQTSQSCESVSFDFSKSSDWQSVFNKPLFVTRPILIDNLYSKPADIESLRLNLETKIKNKVHKWRSHIKTIWNRYCSSLLREMLPHYEYWAFNTNEPRPSAGHRLKQLMATYKIYGFPLNMPYVNTKLIISRIKSTAIYVNDNPNMELALAVEVYAYPNNVLSVWIFLACITRI